ncbi:hypothetical protein MK805_08035 [Shimazuella sp. AN120528]|uniref:hypothetical protein n=1 Tax=Shimazuella soli TaxID=1892854 RepID=UPI001F0FF16A|nr:hypothetical protein [Shimazuella soli]MCH5584921.1 hypothetical protein [Shimazuella soli]
MKNRFGIAFTMSVMVGMMSGFFWTPVARVYETAGFEELVPYIPLGYGVGSLFFIWVYTKKDLDPEKWIFLSSLGLSGIIWGMAVAFKWSSSMQSFLLIVFPALFGGVSGMLFMSTSTFYRSQLGQRAKVHQRGAALLTTAFPLIYLMFSSLGFWVLNSMHSVYVWAAMAACTPLMISIPAWFIFPRNQVRDTARQRQDSVQKKQAEERLSDKKTKEPLLPVLVLVSGPYMMAGYVLGYGFLRNVVLWACLATPAMIVFWYFWIRLFRQKQQIQNQKEIVLTPRLFWLVLLSNLPNQIPSSVGTLYVPLLLKNVASVSSVLSGTIVGTVVGGWIATLIPPQYNRETLTFSYILTGTGLTMVAMQTTVTPIVVFLSLFLIAVASLLLGTIQSQLLFQHMKQKTGAVGVVKLVSSISFVMVFVLGWMTQRFGLPYKVIWGLQLVLLPAGGIALYYLVQYFRIQEEQTWKECRDELMQPVVKGIRSLVRIIVIYTSRLVSPMKKPY